MVLIILLVVGILLLIAPKWIYKFGIKNGMTIEQAQKRDRKIGLVVTIISLILIIIEYIK